MTKRVKLLRAKTGTYTDRNTGQEKTSYATIGSYLKKDDGTPMLKLDTIPVDFDGWVYFGDLPEARPTQQETSQPQQQATQQFHDDTIPF